MFSHICEHKQARQILNPRPFQFLPHVRLIVNKIFRVEQFADDDHRFVAREACSPCYPLVRDSGRNYKTNMLLIILFHVYAKLLVEKYG